MHGGVAGLPKPLPDLGAALEAGAEPGALDAVVRAIEALEDDPSLNAGYGAVLDRAGGVDLDAGIAQGSSRAAGAVACVRVRHPIALARVVLEHTPHVLITGAGAAALAAEHGLEELGDTTPEQRARWAEAHERGELTTPGYGQAGHVDTVGAVALDDDGELAAGSSTGGVFGMLPGRVGDAPVFGAGFYASSQVAVVGTGVGEVFLEELACLRVADLVEKGEDVQQACRLVVERLTGTGTRTTAAGLLALDAGGRVGAAYCGGSWGVWGPDGPLLPERVGA